MPSNALSLEEKEMLQMMDDGDFILRKRRNRRIYVCGGCKQPINYDALIPPYDMLSFIKNKDQNEEKVGKTMT